MNPIPLGIHNFLLLTPIEINLMVLIPEMSKSIPLRARLRIQCQDIIIDCSRLLLVDLLVELLPAKARHFRHVHGPISGDPDPVDYLFCGSQCSFRGETIEHSEFVFGAKETPGVASRPFGLKGEGGKRWGLSHC